jgi:hypothetical protein
MTRRERTLPAAAKASRQPTSTQGVNGALKRGTDRPTKPAKAVTLGTSTAHRPKPRSSRCARMRAADATLSAGDSTTGKCSTTRGG